MFVSIEFLIRFIQSSQFTEHSANVQLVDIFMFTSSSIGHWCAFETCIETENTLQILTAWENQDSGPRCD